MVNKFSFLKIMNHVIAIACICTYLITVNKLPYELFTYLNLPEPNMMVAVFCVVALSGRTLLTFQRARQ